MKRKPKPPNLSLWRNQLKAMPFLGHPWVAYEAQDKCGWWIGAPKPGYRDLIFIPWRGNDDLVKALIELVKAAPRLAALQLETLEEPRLSEASKICEQNYRRNTAP